jgi:hypothetical protein
MAVWRYGRGSYFFGLLRKEQNDRMEFMKSSTGVDKRRLHKDDSLPRMERKSHLFPARVQKICLKSGNDYRSRANLPALEPTQGIVSGIFIHLGKSGIIKARVDKKVRALPQ